MKDFLSGMTERDVASLWSNEFAYQLALWVLNCNNISLLAKTPNLTDKGRKA